MYLTDYALWEHYPKTLILKELMDPLSVVDDFFSCDSLEGHAERLKEWRYYAVNDKIYKDKDDSRSPGGLLFEYDMNLKLLEAVYLLYFNYKTYSYRRKKITEEHLELEKEQWGNEITNLSEKEWQNPYKAVKKIFKEIGPQHYRDYLHDWLHSAFYKRADLDAFNACEVVTVYDNMLKLYSAAWLILKREKQKTESASQPDITENKVLPEISDVRGINPNPTQAEQFELVKLKTFILERFSFVEMIVYLGNHHASQLTFLLILINDNEKTLEHEVSNKIEDHCKHITKVQTIVHKSNSAKEALNMGRRFWATVLDKGFVLYKSPELTLPDHQEITNEILLERAKFNWERWGVQGKEFLKGAELYKTGKNFRLASFLLHQAVESVLKGIIQAAIGYRVQMHNLTRLVRLTLLFSDDLNEVFNLDNDEDIKIFTSLQSAYSKSRYNSDFEPDEESIETLSDKVRQFCAIAEGIYNQYIEQL